MSKLVVRILTAKSRSRKACFPRYSGEWNVCVCVCRMLYPHSAQSEIFSKFIGEGITTFSFIKKELISLMFNNSRSS